MTETWTQERTASLIQLWADGYSARKIAEKLELQSRSAVIGKVRRLDLPTPEKKLAWEQRNSVTKVKTLYSQRVQRPVDDLSERALHIKFLDLLSHHCRFPYGEAGVGEGFTFCGHPKTEASSYCADHARYCCFEVKV